MDDLIDKLINKLSGSEGATGTFMKTCDPAFVEAAGYAGFDFVILDMEHGPANLSQLQNLIRGAQCGAVLPVVRVRGYDDENISGVLDIGAMGIQVPKIANADAVCRVIEEARFAPVGKRGVCRFVRAAGYSAEDRYRYFERANKCMIIIQLEGMEAVENLDEILKVDGFDIVFIGPYDLSQSLGLQGRIDHPAVEEKMLEIVKKAGNAGKCVGTFVDNVANAVKWKLRGVKYLAYSVDVGMFYEYASGIVKSIAEGGKTVGKEI